MSTRAHFGTAWLLSAAAIVAVAGFGAGCQWGRSQIGQEELRAFFAKHRVGESADYAVVKNGVDHLLTIHGYVDDEQVCERLIKPYNKDSSLSVLPGAYTCEPLN